MDTIHTSRAHAAKLMARHAKRGLHSSAANPAHSWAIWVHPKGIGFGTDVAPTEANILSAILACAPEPEVIAVGLG